MRSIYFFSCVDFPRTGSVSNYIQYFVCALADAGYNVKLIVRKNSSKYEYFNTLQYVRNGKITIVELPHKESCNSVFAKLHQEVVYLKKIYSLFLQQKVGKEDLVITYGALIWYLLPVVKLAKSTGCRVAACPVEHFPRESFNGVSGIFSYWLYCLYYNHYLTKIDMCFSISTRIRDSIIAKGGKSTVVPIMADVSEYRYTTKNYAGRYRIIFPANGMMKDALSEMLKAVMLINKDAHICMEFHICGVKENEVRSTIGSEVLPENIIIHKWMEYDELIELYRSMHFMLIARPKNQMTESNFPSKVPEVMTHGIVPIASAVGDYTDFYLKDMENSIVFCGFSSGACYAALSKALSISFSDYLKLSANARKCAEEKFDYHVWSKPLYSTIEGEVFSDV